MRALLATLITLLASASFASTGTVASLQGGLTIHTTEFGVGKFHRYDNGVHKYEAANAWLPYVLAQNAPTDKALTVKNADGSYTIFFSTLDEMMKSVVSISKQTGQKVSVLNIHGHGLPGAMWFPKDESTKNGFMCGDWVRAASGDDVDNYNQYYGAVSPDEIEQIRSVGNNPNVHMSCTTGAREWSQISALNPEFKTSLNDDAQMHFLSCVVGLGTVGEKFTTDIAALILGAKGHVETSMAFGLGDWSMPEGMGFWDMQSEQQVDADNAKYPVDRKDREIMQKGSIRLASNTNGAWAPTVLQNRDFMSLAFENQVGASVRLMPRYSAPVGPLPTRVRIPGTDAYAEVSAH